MRVGQNPAKFVVSVPEPARVSVAIITYIPFLEGYYEHALRVLKTCLGSLWENTRQPYDLLVFDNASCTAVRDFLNQAHQAEKIQYLTLSDKNLGKTGAWNYLFGAAPGEVIAYADADIFFEPGWLQALLRVLDAYPQAGMVTGIPMWSPIQYSTATLDWARATEGVHLAEGKLLPWEDYWRHARSLGQTEAVARGNFDQQIDRMIEDRRGVGAPDQGQIPEPSRFYVGAGHFQFLVRKTVLQELIPLPAEKPMGQVRRLDVAINQAGYLRLSTPEWWVRHLGNTLEDETHGEATLPQKSRRRRGPMRRLVQWIYHRSFNWLYRN